MSKYKCLRPAGMSDDDDDDDYDDYNNDDVFFEKHDFTRKEASKDSRTENDFNNILAHEELDQENDLMNACRMGDLKMLQDHLKNIAFDINKFLHTGWTLLLYATSLVQPEIVEYLLILGADPNKDKEGFTPLMALCNSTKGTSERALKCLINLIQAKADANLTNKQRETALMYACMSQDATFVAELIKHVHDINLHDSDCKTALNYATVTNKPDIVKILLEYNADISFQDRNHLSAKDIADKKGFTEISALLARDEEHKKIITCKVSTRTTWEDLFPDLYPRGEDILDDYILNMLSGMNLESYKSLFVGLNLKTFLQLTEDEVCHLIDISVQREEFLENLEKFHLKKWNVSLLGSKKDINPFSVYDNVILLANVKDRIAVIGASFQYIKNNLIKAANENIQLSPSLTLQYEKELRATKKNLKNLKNEIIRFKKLAQKIDQKDDVSVPAIYIGPKENKSNWTVPLSVTLIVGLYLYKSTMYMQRLWNIYST
ncbi:LOW QUALITY PROTEIN: uncharacterized protein LOC114929954 [Nylanderia fulva]|uniref:LOW QUALITY PROTEIN: uncharacterized protein LOC114929954 n=1 Tax=Nylanderia fulva TaxID=613905 RepID=UPI0010FB256A|nr:LOW QUALITY PROTEIN: uncharacterized protein LOC114929954 [Nylanderia fulva]